MKQKVIIKSSIVILLIICGGTFFVEYYKKSRNKAQCVLNIRNIHQSVVFGYQGIHGLSQGDAIPWNKIFISPSNPDGSLEKPHCPHDGNDYILSTEQNYTT